MSLSSIQLDAFLAVCRTQSFTSAAARLNVTQSALSQRIKNLEDELGTTLFTRDPGGAKPTERGQRLLKFCMTREGLETEFIEGFQSNGTQELRGAVRVAAFSTVTNSLLLPALAKLTQKHEFVSLEVTTAELSELPQILMSGRADFVLVNEPIRREGVANERLGHERNVVVQSKMKATRTTTYLDHDENDSTTLEFLRHHGKDVPKNMKRMFLGKIDAILTGVQLGLGRAVAPRHLVETIKGLEIVKSFGEQKVPVYLSRIEQPFSTELQKAVRLALVTKISEALK